MFPQCTDFFPPTSSFLLYEGLCPELREMDISSSGTTACFCSFGHQLRKSPIPTLTARIELIRVENSQVITAYSTVVVDASYCGFTTVLSGATIAK